MRAGSVVPSSGTDAATDAGPAYSWHTDHYLTALAARTGVFWSATVRVAPTAAQPEQRSLPEFDAVPAMSAPAVDMPRGDVPRADGFAVAVAAPPSSTATVEPLVMASLCNLLYDESGQPSKPDWTPGQWNAALQQQPWTSSWRFVGESCVNPQAYFGVAFENIATGQIVIANRGTQTAYDLLSSDIDILRGIVPPAFLAAEGFAAEVVAAFQGSGRQILVTGHSLGGADAEYQAAKLGLAGSTFAALGARFATSENAPNLVNYLYRQDDVANLAPHIGSVAYLQPNGPVQWFDLLATLPYDGEGLHFINNYLEHFGAPGIEPITPTQFVESIVLAEVADFFSQGGTALAAAAEPLPSPLGFGELPMPGAPSAVSTAPFPAANAGATDWPLTPTLYGAMPPPLYYG